MICGKGKGKRRTRPKWLATRAKRNQTMRAIAAVLEDIFELGGRGQKKATGGFTQVSYYTTKLSRAAVNVKASNNRPLVSAERRMV